MQPPGPSANNSSPRLNQRPRRVTRADLPYAPHIERLALPDLAPTHIIEITARLQDTTSIEVERVISGTIHRVPDVAVR